MICLFAKKWSIWFNKQCNAMQVLFWCKVYGSISPINKKMLYKHSMAIRNPKGLGTSSKRGKLCFFRGFKDASKSSIIILITTSVPHYLQQIIILYLTNNSSLLQITWDGGSIKNTL